ncbi:MAG: hypothetical protein IT449_03260 [Phycisphaerales bacterium]|nr:hypothetical protein [Phycisphaerales bacterium]
MSRIILRAVFVCVLLALLSAAAMTGCGLGYLDAADLPAEVALRIENGTTEYVLVSVTLPDEETDTTTDTAGTEMTNDSEAESPAPRPDNGNSSSEGAPPSTSKRARLAKESVIRIAPGDFSTGTIACSAVITVSAQVGEETPSTVVFSGVGTGTEGFDSGSVGITGERLLSPGADFDCNDTVLVQITGADAGLIVTVPAGQALPDPIQPGTDNVNDNEGDPDGEVVTTVTFQLQNATATAVDFTLAEQAAADGSEGDGGDGETSTAPLVIRVPAGQFTTGELPCGPTYAISGSITVVGQLKLVSFGGDGAGTVGFDEGSVGSLGERYLVFDTHYSCGSIIVATLTDDGSGVGDSTSLDPLGSVSVYGTAEDVPPPETGNVNDNNDGTESVTLAITNSTESYVQLHLTAGNGSTVNSSFDVRVPPGRTTTGLGDCAQQYLIAAYHLEDPDSDEEEGFHTVVLLGDGTGAEGFDGNNVGTDNTRLLILGEHFECAQTLAIEITATNNFIDPDTSALEYGIGDGSVAVE